MRSARVFVSKVYAGDLIEEAAGRFAFEYLPEFVGPPVSLTMPVVQKRFEYDRFPPFFDGLLPEGNRLEALLKVAKLDASDYLGQLITVGQDLVGTVTVTPGEER
jgi:serine/threonine-protein kinase HipA